MKTEDISFTAVNKALGSLERGLAEPYNEISRDACIQRFEYSYELCWKTLKRYVSLVLGTQEYQVKNLYRIAAKAQLLQNLDKWFKYHEARNLTSHTYNETTAEETYHIAGDFLADAKLLIKNMETQLGPRDKQK